MKRFFTILGLLAAAALFACCFPLFHIVPRTAASAAPAAFQAAEFAQSLWREKIVPSFTDAADAHDVVAALRDDPAAARAKFGRAIGLGRTTYFLIRTAGTVVAIDKKSLSVTLTPDATTPDVALQTGPIFGNTIRDATGQLQSAEVANSQQFNEVSAELNRLVEAEVLPQLAREARVGRPIEFVGCAAVTNLPADIAPLRVVPLQVTFK